MGSEEAPAWSGMGQIAFSVADLGRSREFYVGLLGFAYNGRASFFNGAVADKVLATAKVDHELMWLSDRDPDFQLEFVQFTNPAHRPRRSSASEADHGYRRMSLWVADFDATVDRLVKAGHPPLASVHGAPGERRVCVHDPDGVVIELMETETIGPGGGLPVAYDIPVRARGLTLVVPDLDEAVMYFGDVLGMTQAPDFHDSEMEVLWGLAGAERISRCYWCGDHILELVEYQDSAGRGRDPEANLGDAGIYHFALIHPSACAVRRTWHRQHRAQCRSNSKPVYLLVTTLVYLRDPGDNLVECLRIHPWVRRFVGYRGLPEREGVTI